VELAFQMETLPFFLKAIACIDAIKILGWDVFPFAAEESGNE
jgi:hypothetical protein